MQETSPFLSRCVEQPFIARGGSLDHICPQLDVSPQDPNQVYLQDLLQQEIASEMQNRDRPALN